MIFSDDGWLLILLDGDGAVPPPDSRDLLDNDNSILLDNDSTALLD